MNIHNKQLSALRQWILEAAPHLNANISVKLWNGEIIPLNDKANNTIILAINSPEVIRKLIFSPKLVTVFQLYSNNLIDIEGGTPLDAVHSWDHLSILHFARDMKKRDLLKALWPFLFKASSKDNGDNLSYQKSIQEKIDAGRDDKDLIQFHYDVSNDFFGLFLDPEMVYSCGYFEDKSTSLEDAQIAKLDMICKRLRLSPGERLFDVGCGWGGLVCHAVQNYGVEAYGVTLSQEQYDFVQAKIKRLGLEEKITIELKDYRTVNEEESFDKISQIEMFEHVGLDNHDKHFQQMYKLLKPGGLYLHQATTRMATPIIENFRKKTAYQNVITKYIFPGGELDYLGLTITNLERHKFEVHDVESWREHFQMTLEHWVERLWNNSEKAKQEIGIAKTRLWLLYFSLFAVSFERNTISVFQTLASKRKIGTTKVPLTRKDLYC